MKAAFRSCIFTCTVLLLTVFFSGFSFGQSTDFKLPAGCSESDYVPGTIIYKVRETAGGKTDSDPSAGNRLAAALVKIQANPGQPLFPGHPAPAVKTNLQGFPLTDLSRIYECTYQADLSIEEAVNALLATGAVEYAQPRYLVRPLSYVPDDPFNSNQYQLSNMRLYDAWAIEQGDSNMVVAIADWGVELTHPDLVKNIFYNTEDPIDGIDNDNDGYTDNYYGWDMGSNDNDPTGLIVHGTYVAGCSGARTDNGTGVSGTGFRCKFLPIKVADDNNYGSKGYESIVYAADHGCRIINCSWGGTFYPGAFGQDIVNYATFNRNCLVVAACGNSNNILPFYPASYDHVLSVAATNNLDERWGGSSYGYFVDVCAPGQDVWTTAPNGTYNKSSGTSFASPCVSGAAALVWSHFPQYTPMQLTGRLKATCDNIDTLAANQDFEGLLGSGRVNVYRALTDTGVSYVEFLNQVIEDADQDHVFESNDTLRVSGDFYNFLSATSAGFSVTMSSLSPYITMIDSVFSPGSVPASASVSNASQPFSFRLAPDVPASQELFLRLKLADSGNYQYQHISITVNSDFITIDTNQIGITITSIGAIGYNGGVSTQGIGITYNSNRSLISSAGFMVGVSPSRVSDAVIGFDGSVDRDFLSDEQVRKISGMADCTLEGIFNDSLAGSGKLHLGVKQTTMAWDQPGWDRFILLKYLLKNEGSETLTDLYAGIYIDWDIDNNVENQASWDDQRKLGIIHPTAGGTWTGLQLLHGNGVYYYAFDNDGMNGSINLQDGFTGLEKYLTLKSNRLEAGNYFPGNDVSHMVSTGPYILAPGDTAEIVFAVVAGDFLADIQGSADAASQAYSLLSSIKQEEDPAHQNISILPNPFHDQITINLQDGSGLEELRCIDAMGKVLYDFRLSGESKTRIALPGLTPGLYFLEIRTGQSCYVKKLLRQ